MYNSHLGETIAADRKGACVILSWGMHYARVGNAPQTQRQTVLTDYVSGQFGDKVFSRFEKDLAQCVSMATHDAATGMQVGRSTKPICFSDFAELFRHANRNATGGLIRLGTLIEKHRERSTIESSLRLTLAREVWTPADVAALIGIAVSA
jgi:anti-sigma factor RsiW